jgi:hypothetical protein
MFRKTEALSRIQDGEKRLNAVICGQNAPRRYSGGLISAVPNSTAYIPSINGLKQTIVFESTVEKIQFGRKFSKNPPNQP